MQAKRLGLVRAPWLSAGRHDRERHASAHLLFLPRDSGISTGEIKVQTREIGMGVQGKEP